MYELLLQADKALADGALDQAEQTYWQLIELDPANAIAVAGLARVSLERGDERLARRFADRAMTIDPESVAARRVVEALEHRGAEHAEAELPDLPLIAAQRLEALSRRRSTASPELAEEAGSSAAAADGSKTKRADAVETAAHPATGPVAGSPGDAQPGSRPDLIPELPSEPLKDRRQAGRQAGRQAATPPPRHNPARREPHHAMPSRKRHFDADELRAPTQNAYSAAEAAAAAEAVDAMDAVEEPPENVPGRVSGAAEDPEAAHATEAEASVAMRIALVVDATELDAAELEAAETIEAQAAAADESVTLGVTPVADAVEREAAELEAAWVREEEARWTLEVAGANAAGAAIEADATVPPVAEANAAGPAPAGSIEDGLRVAEPRAEELEAAEAEAARLAPKEMLEAQSAEPGDLVEQEALSRPSLVGGAGESSERDAEIQALREALAIVLGSESQAGSAALGSAADAARLAATSADRSDEPAALGESAAPIAAAEPAQPTPHTEPESASGRKKGLFHRFGGR